MYLVYILKSDNYSYIGMTNDFFRRWKQHDRFLKVVQDILQKGILDTCLYN